MPLLQASYEGFVDLLAYLGINMEPETIIKGSSLEWTDTALLEKVGGRRFRLFHVDGGHYVREGGRVEREGRSGASQLI